MSSSAFLLPKAASTGLASTPRAGLRHTPPPDNASLLAPPPLTLPESRNYLRLPAVRDLTGLPTSTIYRYVKLGQFPKAHRLGPRTVGWLQSEIDQWLTSREAA